MGAGYLLFGGTGLLARRFDHGWQSQQSVNHCLLCGQIRFQNRFVTDNRGAAAVSDDFNSTDSLQSSLLLLFGK